jgi:hypothetical protein
LPKSAYGWPGFVIADLSDAKSVIQELQAIVPNSPKLPVQPVIIASQQEPGMFNFIEKFPWVLNVCRYGRPHSASNPPRM